MKTSAFLIIKNCPYHLLFVPFSSLPLTLLGSLSIALLHFPKSYQDSLLMLYPNMRLVRVCENKRDAQKSSQIS